jgi:hypothetical protein
MSPEERFETNDDPTITLAGELWARGFSGKFRARFPLAVSWKALVGNAKEVELVTGR